MDLPRYHAPNFGSPLILYTQPVQLEKSYILSSSKFVVSDHNKHNQGCTTTENCTTEFFLTAMETGPWFKVKFVRLEKPLIKPQVKKLNHQENMSMKSMPP